MAALTDQQIAQYAKGAGFSGSGLAMAIAICLAESGGDPAARGVNKGRGGIVTSVDRGLWQINSVYHSEVTDACAFNPTCCAGAAYRISAKGADWRPWSTYGSGAYRQYMSRAQAAANSGSAGSPTSPQPAPPPTGVTADPSVLPLWKQVSAGATSYASAHSGVDTLAFGATGSDEKTAFLGPFRQLVAGLLFFGVLYLLSKTRSGYTLLQLGEALILLFLFATQAQYFREGLLPFLSKSHGETPPGPVQTAVTLPTNM